MSRLRITLLALLLGLPAAASADESAWGTAPGRAAPPAAAQLGRPVIAQTPAAPAPVAPAVLLERPRLAGFAAPPSDPDFRPASFTPVFRGQLPDAKPMPSGPPASADAPVVSQNWQRATPVAGPVQAAPPPAGVIVAPGPDGAPADCGGCSNNCGGCSDSCGGCGWRLGSLFHHGLFGCKEGADSACCGSTCADSACAGACDGAVCDGACGCGCPPGNHLYVSAEYLLWWTKGDPVPPLITQGSVGDLAHGLPAGALGLNDTTILFGGTNYNTGPRSGGRLMAGWWFGDDHCIGLEGGGFFLASKSTSFSETAIGTPLLARPFFDTTAGGMSSREEVSFINSAGAPVLAGTAAAFDRNSFYGAEVNLRSNLWCGPSFNLDVIGGYRFVALNDNLGVSENLTGVGPAAGFLFASNDNFRVRNNFNGGQIGLDAEFRRNRWFVDLKTKIALGNVTEHADITGATASSFNGVAQPVGNGGLLTTDRVGSYSQHHLAFLPEVGLNVGYNLTEHVRAFVGYDFLYLSNVVRAGDQVNLNVNPNRFLGGGGPANSPFAFHTSNYWAQGVNLGLEFRW